MQKGKGRNEPAHKGDGGDLRRGLGWGGDYDLHTIALSAMSLIASNKTDSEGTAREAERSRDAEEREREGQERADADWWQREKERARVGLEQWDAQKRQAGEDPFALKKQTKEEIDQQAVPSENSDSRISMV